MSTGQLGDDLDELLWNKSSYSGSDGGDCVEVAAGHGTVRVRDSKNRALPLLAFAEAEWAAFVSFAAE